MLPPEHMTRLRVCWWRVDCVRETVEAGSAVAQVGRDKRGTRMAVVEELGKAQNQKTRLRKCLRIC